MFELSGYKVGSIGGVEISISVGYLFIMGFIIFLNGFPGSVLFAAAITLSVLIHELGHAVVCKYYNLSPSVLLHGFGGLCFHSQAKSDGNDVLIVLAGPVIEIIVGVLAFLLLMVVPMPTILTLFFTYFAWVSVVWGAINLFLPLWPLDGGRLFNLILRRFVDENRAQDWTLKVSAGLAIPCGIVGLMAGHYFIAFLAFFLLMDNIQALQSGADIVGRKAKERTSDFAVELLADADTAFADEDWREAYRVCHQIRSGTYSLSKKDLSRLHEILAITAVKLEEWDEAKGWLERAPKSAMVQEAEAEWAQHA